MNAADPLAALKDIHLPPPVSVWPPAPGWWVLAGLLLLALIAAVWLGLRWWRRRAYRRVALQELRDLEAQWQQHRDDRQLQTDVNRLLKQVALAAFPRTQVAALHGPDWLQFLDAQLRQPVFAEPAMAGLAESYRATPVAVAPETLLRAARDWIRRHHCS
ncbi:MAG: DUF4381 domain-containing protein [Spongiibacteraceae bacterium]